ncbi:universal stress protein [Pigmentibacter ruber]|uniref:universal stress protein n=1 Tax=Pigmentibacter ruber TaxID=2683196 RepID=UPI00131E0041|nr:universal stress protein [Pigmentibacter ruber]
MASYNKVLICTDFSDASIKSFEKAFPLAKLFNSEIHICHVVTPVASIPVHGYYYPMNIDLEKEAMAEAEEKMKMLIENRPINKENIHIFFSDPKEGIVAFAKELNIDLIMIAGHHHSFIGMLGSTANYVANKTYCDVLIINQ